MLPCRRVWAHNLLERYEKTVVGQVTLETWVDNWVGRMKRSETRDLDSQMRLDSLNLRPVRTRSVAFYVSTIVLLGGGFRDEVRGILGVGSDHVAMTRS